MIKIVAGFLFGIVTCSAVFMIAIIPSVKDSYRKVGFNDGLLEAKLGIANLVSAQLGSDIAQSDAQQVFYDVKTTRVVVVERNGVRTLRISPIKI